MPQPPKDILITESTEFYIIMVSRMVSKMGGSMGDVL